MGALVQPASPLPAARMHVCEGGKGQDMDMFRRGCRGLNDTPACLSPSTRRGMLIRRPEALELQQNGDVLPCLSSTGAIRHQLPCKCLIMSHEPVKPSR